MNAQELARTLTGYRGQWSDLVDTPIVATINNINAGRLCSFDDLQVHIKVTVDRLNFIWHELEILYRDCNRSIRMSAAQAKWNQAMKDVLFLHAAANIILVHEGDDSCANKVQDCIRQAENIK